jgi:hypothetical protein
MGNIDHHIAGADYGHMLAHVERPVAETGQPIEMVDHIFRVKDPFSRTPFNPDSLGPLRADRKHDCAGAKVSDLFDGEIFTFADRDIAEIVNVRSLEQFPVLLLETAAQLEFCGEDPVFSQPAELNVTIQDDDFMACLRE